MKQIQRAAVLGAGVMGAAIAAHLANAGIEVLLLDMAPEEPVAAENEGIAITDPAVRNRIAAAGIEGLRKMKPAPFFLPAYESAIDIGNFEDDMSKLRECDWVVEAVVENLEIKRKLLERVAPNLKEGAILSTNTSGLSVDELAECLPDGVQRNFLVIHFFNPPRYMRLLEMVPCRHTDQAVTEFMTSFIAKRLGKGVVHAKNTPNFIANRIGVYAFCNCIRHMVEMGMTVEEVDAVTGTATARPKSATFRTADLVGIDTLQHVANHAYELLVNDEQREVFRLPDFVQAMVTQKLLGNKNKQGFYKKVTEGEGSVVYYYDYASGEYTPSRRPKFVSVETAKSIGDPGKKLQALLSGTDNGALLAWKNLRDTLIYTFNRIPEIADDILNIDNAMKWGFNWEIGPFQMLDAIGVKHFTERAEQDGVPVPAVLKTIEPFYSFERGKNLYFNILDNDYSDVPQKTGHISLSLLKNNGGMVDHNSSASVIDLGDGVFCLEFHSKMNTIGNETLAMVHKGVKRAEEEGVGLIIANEGGMFSAGANLMLLVMAIAEGAYDEIALMVKGFQKAMMAIKYSKIPVVAAPHNLAMGGGCEACLHADAINAHTETYMGLVEIGVGLLPAGGGTKEMALRAIKLADENDVDVSPFIIRNFRNIALARVSTSAADLHHMGFMRQGDAITMDIDRRIHDAKQKAIALAATYRPDKPSIDLKAPGRSVAASIKSQLWNMRMGGYITEFEEFLGSAVADVITGGDVPAGTLVTENYLLDLEREAFLRLCGQKKTMERIQHMLKKGKPLRN